MTDSDAHRSPQTPRLAKQGRKVTPMTPYRSTRDVAAELGVAESVVHDAVRRRLVPEVPMIGHSRLWDAEAVASLRAVLERRHCPRGRVSSTGRPDGGLGARDGSAGGAS